MNPSGCAPLGDDTLWGAHSTWAHSHKTSSTYKIPNRWHHRGSTPSLPMIDPRCKYPNYFELGLQNPDSVVSHNNPYAYDTPAANVMHSTFSIFGDRVPTMHDIQVVMEIYERIMADKQAEEKYGPFDQTNLNIAGQNSHNNLVWNQGWKQYQDKNSFKKPVTSQPVILQSPYILRLSFLGAEEFVKAINRSMWQMQTGNPPEFHIAKQQIYKSARSSITGFIRFTMIVGITRNTESYVFYFLVDIYADPAQPRADSIRNPGAIILGNARFLGLGTTDKILLPDGPELDTIDYYRGRPLHPAYANLSEMPSDGEVKQQFFNNLKKSRAPITPLASDISTMQSMPFWFRSRLREQKGTPAYGSKQ